MTRFLDGPAAGRTMVLARAPLLLRVVNKGDYWDALDQLVDELAPGETATAYARCGRPTCGFVDGRGADGRRWGRRFVAAEYRVVGDQPAQEVMADNARWQAWCSDRLSKTAGEQHAG